VTFFQKKFAIFGAQLQSEKEFSGGDKINFIEVKFHGDSFDLGREAVAVNKQNSISKVVCKFDIIEIGLDKTVEYLENCF